MGHRLRKRTISISVGAAMTQDTCGARMTVAHPVQGDLRGMTPAPSRTWWLQATPASDAAINSRLYRLALQPGRTAPRKRTALLVLGGTTERGRHNWRRGARAAGTQPSGFHRQKPLTPNLVKAPDYSDSCCRRRLPTQGAGEINRPAVALARSTQDRRDPGGWLQGVAIHKDRRHDLRLGEQCSVGRSRPVRRLDFHEPAVLGANVP
jgi:hypothetical protein